MPSAQSRSTSPRSPRDLVRRLVAALTGTVLGLLVLLAITEAGLRLVGALWAQPPAEASIVQPIERKRTFTVLSLGDSFTYGIGAPDDQSYPVHLGVLLRNETTLGAVRMVNRGLPGKNTTQVWLELRRQLSRVRPDLVLVMAGGANYFNFWGHGLTFEPGSGWHNRWRDMLAGLRVVKLIVRLVRHHEGSTHGSQTAIHETPASFRRRVEAGALIGYSATGSPGPHINLMTPEPPGGADERKFSLQEQELVQWLLARVRQAPNAARYYFGLAELNARRARYAEAEQWLKRGLSQAPGSGALHYFMGIIEAGVKLKPKAAEGWFRRGMTVDPSCGHNYFAMGELLVLQAGLVGRKGQNPGDNVMARAARWFEQGAAADPRLAPDTRRIVARLTSRRSTDQQQYRWIRADLEALVQTAQKRKTRLVLITYPRNSKNKPALAQIFHNANRAMADVARAHGVPLVRAQRAFASAAADGTPEHLLYADDVEHPSGRGYQELSREVFRTLVRHKLVPRSPNDPVP